MRYIISPTKNMKPRTWDLDMTLPSFLVEAEILLSILKQYNDEDIMQIMKVNAKLAVENQQRFQSIQFDAKGTPALMSYDGLQFKYMKLDTWKEKDFYYANDHLRIISGFYGVVKPSDSIYPYRLEMQARLRDERIDNLYSFWSDALMQELRKDNEDAIYINLASKEYSDAILPYIRNDERCITIHFQLLRDGRYCTQATDAKMARGDMIRYLIQQQIEDVDGIKAYCGRGYRFDAKRSNEQAFYFIK